MPALGLAHSEKLGWRGSKLTVCPTVGQPPKRISWSRADSCMRGSATKGNGHALWILLGLGAGK